MDLTRPPPKGALLAAGAAAGKAPDSKAAEGGAVHDKEVTKTVLRILEVLLRTPDKAGASDGATGAGDSDEPNLNVLNFIHPQVTVCRFAACD